MAKIYGTFATINNNHLVRVSIYNKALSEADINIDTSDTVKFAADPVEITQQQDDTFTHILTTQCKIRLVTRQWLGDYLFAANYSSIVVNVWVDGDCAFAGFVVPRTYNQNYAHQWEEVEINCIDVLSTLKDRRLTDTVTYEELVAQSTTRPFSWFLGNIDLDSTSVVIPNFPDIDYQEAEMAWYEVDWTRIVNPDDSINYYGIEAEVVILDDETAMNTGNERQGELKTVTWIESTDTCIVDGVSYYKEYAHITVAGEDVNTGDWRVGSDAGGMPQVVRTENRVDGWTVGVLPQPFDFWEHYTTYNIYDNGMEIAASDGIGEQIPLSPSTTTAGSYYEFRQGASDDLDIDENTGYIYYKDYAWVCIDNECENSGQWQRGNEKCHPTGTHTAVTGWQYDDPPVAFEYYETISHYIDYSDGSERLDYTSMGHQIPLTPSTTTNGSYYEYRQGDADDLDVDPITGYEYYKDYAWVVVNNVAEKTNNWSRGTRYFPYFGDYLTIEATSNGNISISLSSNLTSSDLTSFSYSKDKTNWTTWTNDEQGTTITIPMTSGDKVYLKGSGQRYSYMNNSNGIISSTCNVNVYGNIMSLLNEYNFATALTVYNYSFHNLFRGCNNILNVSNLVLPATTLGTHCYSLMFCGCQGLIIAPTILPATTLADYCYYGMFEGCHALTTAPSLPATTAKAYCYNLMFAYCYTLTTAPSLPATTLANNCYTSMFEYCTSLTTAPTLSATTMKVQCYRQMFAHCTSLTTAPSLPATRLDEECYLWMFTGCTALTTAPSLNATSLAKNCYCTMFSGCTALTSAPSLPATTLQDCCYFGMFEYCTSLTTAPTLAATTLKEQCYDGMFRGCSNLSSITMLATDISAPLCLNNWVNGVSRSGTFTKASSMTTLPTGNSGIPSGWTVQNA